MTWLVTGGAGYIGSHVVRAFAEQDIPTVVVDDLSSGHRSFVAAEVPFYEGSVTDGALLRRVFDQHSVAGVVHLAAFKYAGVSVSRPLHTYTDNVTGMIVLLEAMASHDVARCVFSSSAAVYGTPDVGLVTEATPTRPESPYGESKLIGEWLLARPGPGHRRPAAPAHLAALLQRGRVRLHRPARHQPAQPVPADLRRAGRGADAAHQRGRLPDPGRHLRPRLRARRGPGGLPRRRRAGDAGRASRSSRSTTSAAAPDCRSGRSWTRWPGSPASPSPPRSRPPPGRPGADRGYRRAGRPGT